MDLNLHLNKVVEGLVADITANVLVRVDSVISAAINNRLELEKPLRPRKVKPKN